MSGSADLLLQDVPETVRFWATLGVGGTLGGMIFWFYRQDRLSERNGAQERIGRQEEREKQLLEVIKENSSAQANLAQILQAEKDAGDRLAQALEGQSRGLVAITAEMKSHSQNDERAFRAINKGLMALLKLNRTPARHRR